MPRHTRLAVLVLFVAGCSTAPVTPSASNPASSTPTAAATAIASTEPTVSPTENVVPSQAPSAVAALDGMPADPALSGRLPIAVMIDDNVVARPQAGFNAASIVYQAPADGGEDRYMLVFQEGDSAVVGPVRSGRPYFVRWAAEYRALFGHYGGDAKTLAYIPTITGSLLFNLDALSGSAAAYHRVSTRAAPHNAYTSTASMRAVGETRGAPASMVPGLAARLFAPPAPLGARPAGGSISIPYGSGTTSYSYDAASNTYLRSVGGRAQIDAADGKRVSASDVVVLYMGLSIDPDSEPGHHRPVLAQIGSGKALVFRNGSVVVGTWRKADAGSLTRFVDSSGTEIPLVPGGIFVQVVAIGTNVTYKAS